MPNIAIIAAQWHAEIVEETVSAFTERLQEHGIDTVDVYRVPGAFEIPLHAKRLARSGRYDAVATSALVVDGGIYRHDFVASTVVDALMRVQLETDVPVFSAVLTPHNFHEHDEHREYFKRHFGVKGRELADAVAKTIESLSSLD